jgi:putative lipoic acid-binding regulatory protein
MPNPAAMQAAHARAIHATGQPVTFQRKALGAAPQTFTASVVAIVRNAMPAATNEGYSGKPGSVTEAGRQVLVMKADLAAEGFPMPVKKGDRIQIAEAGEWLQVEQVDNAKRFLAGCVELTAKGID